MASKVLSLESHVQIVGMSATLSVRLLFHTPWESLTPAEH